jgi:hypothetical protein
MTFQPPAVLFPDVELWASAYLRTALAARPEAYAADVRVANSKSTTTTNRQVVVRRDGGAQNGVLDFPRLSVRVWANREQDAADLSRLVQALLMVSPGNGPVVACTSLSGPQGIPDESQPQKFLAVELTVRGANL